MKNIVIAIVILFSGLCNAQVNDSINTIIHSKKSNLDKIKHLNKLCEGFWLAGNYKESKLISDTLFYLEKQELSKLPDNKDILKEKAITYNNLAIVYRFQGDYSASLDNHLKALKIREKINDVRGIARSHLGIGTIYEFTGKYETALSYKLKAKKLFEQARDTAFVGFTCSHIAGIYFTMGKIKEAEAYNTQALTLFRKINNFTGMSDAYTQAGMIFEYGKNYSDAINNYEGSLQSNTLLGLKDRVISSNIDLGRVYIKINKADIANQYLEDALQLSKQTGSKLHLSEIYQLFYKRDSAMQHFGPALTNYQMYIKYEDSLVNQKSSEEMAKLQLKFESEKADEIKKLEEEKKESIRKNNEQRQKLILYSVVTVLLLVLAFSFFIFRSYKQKQKVNSELLLKNEIIEKQKQLVEEKQTEILDSINYAKRIQYSLLASEKLLNENLSTPKEGSETGGGYFVFFKPKDVVSGDFYWGSKLGNGNFALVTADSTGHGVPGSIMSMLNISCLNEAINTDKLTQPAEILNAVRKKIINHLSNDGSVEGGKDGMDCSLVSFDFKNKKLAYAAANNPVWVIRSLSSFKADVRRKEDVEFISLVADRMPVGKHDKDSIPFTQHEFDLQSGDMIYTLTDGFPDQFGGPKGKKFKYKQLEELLISVSHKSIKEQEQALRHVFEDWKGHLEQVDDVCIIGVRV
ncbi:MAG: tetratricopeptide repeat protein [Bacteroidetes bacterium]|nr:tetratricopeptide repeat protein [Bacteroidota bacterium]